MNAARIAAAVLQAGLHELTGDAAGRFEQYLTLLLKWNAGLNLTATRDPETLVHRHFLDCIQCAQALPEAATLLDFGSGAGLPGIPIALCRPEVHVTLAESQRKKAAFLREAVRTLALNAEVFDGRVEAMPLGAVFEAVTLRAVDKMAAACRTARARVAPGGWVVLFSTEAGKAALQSELPGVVWRREVPAVGMDQGVILLGQAALEHGMFHVEQF